MPEGTDKAFAYVDTDGNGHLPIGDEQAVRQAIESYATTDFDSVTTKEETRLKLAAAASKYGIELGEDSPLAESAKVRKTGKLGGSVRGEQE